MITLTESILSQKLMTTKTLAHQSIMWGERGSVISLKGCEDDKQGVKTDTASWRQDFVLNVDKTRLLFFVNTTHSIHSFGK